MSSSQKLDEEFRKAATHELGLMNMLIKPHCFEIDGNSYEWTDHMYYIKVAEKTDGDGFGQDALIHNAFRNASIKTESEEIHLATLD